MDHVFSFSKVFFFLFFLFLKSYWYCVARRCQVVAKHLKVIIIIVCSYISMPKVMCCRLEGQENSVKLNVETEKNIYIGLLSL